jgi:site-specific DNA-methyltransferase (adenine-specific)
MNDLKKPEKPSLTREEKAQSELDIDIAFSSKSHGSTSHKIYNHSSANMNAVEDNSVHLAVTSPPYFNAKEYSQWNSLEDYLSDMRAVISETLRTLVPGRKFCLNISDLPEKGESGVRWIPLGAHLALLAQEVGFEIVDRIIWFKTPLKGFQYGSLPYPPSPLICDSMEYIYVLRKPLGKSKVDYKHVNSLQKEASKLKRDDYIEYTKQIWSLRRVRRQHNLDGHIAPYPLDIPERCIRLYSFVGETVLDPFAGSGTTNLAAVMNRRNSIGYELQADYISYINERMESAKGHDEISPREYGEFQVDYFG